MREYAYEPEYVYIELGSSQKIAKLKVSVGDKVLQGELLAISKFIGNIYASVSGEVVEIVDMMTIYAKKNSHLKIKNDKLYQKYLHNCIDPNSLTDIRHRISEFLDYRRSPRELFNTIDFDIDYEYVIIDGISINEKSNCVNQYLLKNEIEKVNLGVKLLKTTLPRSKFFFISNLIKESPMTDVIYNKYDNNSKFKVIKKLLPGKDLSNLEKEKVLYIGVKEVSEFYNYCIDNNPESAAFINIYTETMNQFLIVPKGTLFSELCSKIGFQITDKVALSGSLYSFKKLKNLDFAIFQSNSYHLTEDFEINSYNCINCGDCDTHCPVDINPKEIMIAEINEDEKRIQKLNAYKCIECGMCTFVCSSNIDVLSFLRRSLRRIK